MENLNGIELAAALRKQGNDTAIVFISINREMALKDIQELFYHKTGHLTSRGLSKKKAASNAPG